MSKLIFLIVLLTLLHGSCSKSDNGDESAIIEYEMACGRCSGTTSLVIRGGDASYLKTIPCGTNKSTISKNLNLRAIEWENLLKSFNHSQFLKLSVNECGVCFDGCDERLKITREGIVHEIRFLPANTPAETESLVYHLKEVIQQFEKP